MIERGEGSWVQLVVAVGPPKEIYAIAANAHDRVRRGRSIGAPMIETAAEVGLAKLRHRPPDIEDTDVAANRDEDKEKSVIRKTKGKSIGGRILKTTRTRLSEDKTRLVEESTASLDGAITRMGDCGPKSLDKTGGQRPISDDYSEESSP
jgi:hypothetical protein